jgi:hypothetical protein
MRGSVRSFACSYLVFVEDYYGLSFARQQIACGHARDSGADDTDIDMDILVKRGRCGFFRRGGPN